MRLLAGTVLVAACAVHVYAGIQPEIVQSPLFDFDWDVHVTAGSHGAGGQPSIPLTVQGDLSVDGRHAEARVDKADLTLAPPVLATGNSSGFALLHLGLELEASARAVEERDGNGQPVAGEDAGFSVHAKLGTKPDYASWSLGMGAAPLGAEIRFVYDDGAGTVPGQPIVFTPVDSRMDLVGETQVGNGGTVTGSADYGTMLDLRPRHRQDYPEYGGRTGSWVMPVFGGGSISITGQDPFDSGKPVLGQLGYNGVLADLYRDTVRLGAWIDAQAQGTATGEGQANLSLDYDITVGVKAKPATRTAFGVHGYDAQGAPIQHAARVQRYVQPDPDPTDEVDGDNSCSETSGAMIIDYWNRRLRTAAGIDPSDTTAIQGLKQAIRGRVPPTYHGTRHVVSPWGLSTAALPAALNTYFDDLGMDLEAVLVSDPRSFDTSALSGGPLIARFEGTLKDGSWFEHAVVIDGYCAYEDPGMHRDVVFVSVKDTWAAAVKIPLVSGGIPYTEWSDLQGLEWWPVPDMDVPYGGRGQTRIVLTDVILVGPRGRHPVLWVDAMATGLAARYGATETVTLACEAPPGTEPGELMLRATSADGTGQVFFPTSLCDEVGVAFDYLLSDGAEVVLSLNGTALATLLPTAEPLHFEQTFDLAALGIDPQGLGEWAFEFKAPGDPDLWLDNLQVLNPNAIPEPGTLTLLAVGGLRLLTRRRRRQAT